MDKELAELFRSRWDAVAAIEAAEQQTATLAYRWNQLNKLYQLGLELGLLQIEEAEMSMQHHWAKLKGAEMWRMK
jgi:hypothetical protein